MERARSVLSYIDDANYILTLWPDFPEHREHEITMLAWMLRCYFKAQIWLRSLEHLGFRFKIEQEVQTADDVSSMWNPDGEDRLLLHLSDMRRY